MPLIGLRPQRQRPLASLALRRAVVVDIFGALFYGLVPLILLYMRPCTLGSSGDY
jgi:hypothetical protein